MDVKNYVGVKIRVVVVWTPIFLGGEEWFSVGCFFEICLLSGRRSRRWRLVSSEFAIGKAGRPADRPPAQKITKLHFCSYEIRGTFGWDSTVNSHT